VRVSFDVAAVPACGITSRWNGPARRNGPCESKVGRCRAGHSTSVGYSASHLCSGTGSASTRPPSTATACCSIGGGSSRPGVEKGTGAFLICGDGGAPEDTHAGRLVELFQRGEAQHLTPPSISPATIPPVCSAACARSDPARPQILERIDVMPLAGRPTAGTEKWGKGTFRLSRQRAWCADGDWRDNLDVPFGP
jgi:hypothetical protein